MEKESLLEMLARGYNPLNDIEYLERNDKSIDYFFLGAVKSIIRYSPVTGIFGAYIGKFYGYDATDGFIVGATLMSMIDFSQYLVRAIKSMSIN